MRNNRFRTSESKQRFSIRKCNVGVVSVLLGLSFAFIAGNQVASADEVANTEAPAAIVEKKSEASAATAAEPEASVAPEASTAEATAAPESGTTEAKPEATAAPESGTTEAKPEATAAPEAATTASAQEATAEPKAATGETAPAAEATATAPTNAEKSGEWKEKETVTNKEAAEAKATLNTNQEPVKDGYKVTEKENFKTFLIFSLSGDQEPNYKTDKTSGSFNHRFDKDWYIRFSTDTVTDSGKVLAELVDKQNNNTVLEEKEILPAERPTGIAFNKIKETAASSNIDANKKFVYNMKNREFTFTDKEGKTSILRNLEIESGVGDSALNTIVYSPLTPERKSQTVNDLTSIIPLNTVEQVTKYILEGTAYKPEKELASYTQTGNSGDIYTIAGPADFDKYELIKEPDVFDGEVSPTYLKDSYILKSYPGQNQAKVQLVSKEDGTSKFMTFALNPDHEDAKKYNGKPNITADDMKLNEIIDIINNSSLSNEEKTNKIKELNSPFLLMYVSKDIKPKEANEGADLLTGKKEWSFTSKYLWKPLLLATDNGKQPATSHNISGHLDAIGNLPEANWMIRVYELVNENGEPIDFDGTVLTGEERVHIGGMQNGLANTFSPGTEASEYYYAEKGGVIVHFIDEKGNKISSTETLIDHASTGSSYDTSTVKKDKIVGHDDTVYFLRENSPIDEVGGIKLPSDPKSVGDRFTTETIDERGKVVRDTVLELTYVYVKAGGVNVHYENEEGEEIKAPVVDEKDAKPGTKYNTEDKKEGTITTKDGKTYEYKEVKNGSDAEDGDIESGKDKKVTYVYREIKGNVIVHYQDEEGNPLEGVDENSKEVPNTVTDTEMTSTGTEYNTTDHKPNTITTKEGKTYELVPESTIGKETGKVEPKTIDVVYVYREVKGDVIVKYFDEAGKPLEGVDENKKEVPNTVTDTKSASTGTDYNTTDNKPKTITTKDGKTYELIPERTEGEETGKVKVEPTVVKYFYKEVKGDVVVYYEDENGNRLEGVDENSNPVNKIAVDTPLSSTGTDYDTTDKRPKEITTKDGQKYVLVPEKTYGTEKGKVVPGTTEVTYVYKKYVAPKPPTPIDPLTPYIPGSGDPGTPNPGTPNPGTPNPGTPNPGTPNPGTPDPSNPNPGTPNPGTPNPGTPNPNTPDSNKPNGNGNRTPGNNGGRDNYRKVVKNNKKDVDKLPQMGNEDTKNFAAIGAVALAGAIGVAATSKRKEEN